MPITGQRARVPGIFTVFYWEGSVVAFANSVQVFSVTPVAEPEVIQPMNATRPVEIVTPGGHTYGRIILTLTELYNKAVWQRLSGLAQSNDISDIMRTVAALDRGITIQKWVNPPQGVGGERYLETFYECVVARVGDDETIDVTTTRIDKELELWYTYSVKHYINSPRNPSTIFQT